MSPTFFVERPIFAVFALASVATVAWSIIRTVRSQRVLEGAR